MKNTEIDRVLNSIFSENKDIDVKSIFDKKLNEYNITKSKALKLLSIDKDVFEEIINGTAKQPNLINIIKIAEFLEIEIDKLIQIVLTNQNSSNIAALENARKTTFLLRNFDVKALTKLGFFNNNDDTNQLVDKVLKFFGYSTIKEFEELLEEPLFSRTKRSFSDKMKDFWVKSAYQTFKVIDNPNEYNRKDLKELIIKIKPYSRDIKNGLYTVCKALYNIGVTVIFQDYLATTQVRGGTFIVNNKPCIVLTDFNKKYPTIWFTLLHELHHVLFDFELIESTNFHLSGDNDLLLIEEKADSFARDYFFSEEKFHYIKRYINSPIVVIKFAREIEVHESIIYSFFTYYQNFLYGNNYNAAFKEYYPNCKEAIERLNPISWNEESLMTTSEKIKSILELKIKQYDR